MKKLIFIGLLLFAFQNRILAQENFGISIGGGLHYLNLTFDPDNIYDLDATIDPSNLSESTLNERNSLTPTFNIGVNYKVDLLRDKLFCQIGLKYHFLPSTTYIYASDKVNLNLHSVLEVLPTSNLFTKNYHLFTLPFGVYFKTKRISPGIGAEAYLKTSSAISYTYSADDGNGNSTPQEDTYRIALGGANVFGEVQVHLSKRFDLNLKYATELTKQLLHIYGDLPFNATRKRFDVTLRYRLGSKKMVENIN